MNEQEYRAVDKATRAVNQANKALAQAKALVVKANQAINVELSRPGCSIPESFVYIRLSWPYMVHINIDGLVPHVVMELNGLYYDIDGVGTRAVAYNEGYDAFKPNATNITNPYEGDSANEVMWWDGWRQAMDDYKAKQKRTEEAPEPDWPITLMGAYNQGYTAQSSVNPYAKGTKEFEAWANGQKVGELDYRSKALDEGIKAFADPAIECNPYFQDDPEYDWWNFGHRIAAERADSEAS